MLDKKYMMLIGLGIFAIVFFVVRINGITMFEKVKSMVQTTS